MSGILKPTSVTNTMSGTSGSSAMFEREPLRKKRQSLSSFPTTTTPKSNQVEPCVAVQLSGGQLASPGIYSKPENKVGGATKTKARPVSYSIYRNMPEKAAATSYPYPVWSMGTPTPTPTTTTGTGTGTTTGTTPPSTHPPTETPTFDSEFTIRGGNLSQVSSAAIVATIGQVHASNGPKSCLKTSGATSGTSGAITTTGITTATATTASKQTKRKRSVSFSQVNETYIIPARGQRGVVVPPDHGSAERTTGSSTQEVQGRARGVPIPMIPRIILVPLPSSYHQLPPESRGSKYSSITFESLNQDNPGVIAKYALPTPIIMNGDASSYGIKNGMDLVLGNVGGNGYDEVILVISWPGYELVIEKRIRLSDNITRVGLLEVIAQALVNYAIEVQAKYPTMTPYDRRWNLTGQDATAAGDMIITRLVHSGGRVWIPEIWVPER